MATYIVNTKYTVLNVRKYPGTDAAIVGSLAKDSEIEVEEIVDGWARIKYNDATAYCSAEYLKEKEVTATDWDNLKF